MISASATGVALVIMVAAAVAVLLFDWRDNL